MAHPYVDLLRDRYVRVLWSGLALSSIGSELYRVAAVWLAAELAGPSASLLVTAQAAAILAASLVIGPMVEHLPRRRLLVAAELVSAAAALAVVVAAGAVGLTFPVLMVASALLAAIGATVAPVLRSSLPQLASAETLRATNGLFDGTFRTAQSVGPFLAAAAIKVMPAIHLLTANAVSFLASAAALAALGRRLDAPAAGVSTRGVLRRLGRGISAANGCPGVWSVLNATSIRGAAWALGFTVAVPLLFAQQSGAGGLGAVALVFGITAAAELLANPVVVLLHPRRPLRRLFEGYALIGFSLLMIGAAAALPGASQIVAMCLFGMLMGVGNAVAGNQLMTFFSARLTPDDHAAVLRLRQAMIVSAMLVATAAGPLILTALGNVGTILACGAASTVAGLLGAATRPAGRLNAAFEPG